MGMYARLRRSAAALAALLIAATAWAQPDRGAEAPVFRAIDVRDQTVDLADELAKEPDPLVLFFFTPDHGRDLAERLREVHGKLAKVIAVGLKADADALRAFAEDLRISYYVIENSPELNADALYGPFQVLPVTIFITSDKTILKVITGGGEGQANVITRIAETHLQKARSVADEAQRAARAEAARSAAEIAMAQHEDAAEARQIVGYAHAAEGKLDEAERAFDAIASIEGKAYVALERGDLDRAAELAASAGSAYAQAVRGKALMRQGRLDEAAQAFNAAAEQDAADWQRAEALAGRGRLRQQAGDTDAALQDYQQAIAMDAFNADALSNAGDAYRSAGDLEAAQRTIERAAARGVQDDLMAMMLRQIQEDRAAGADAARSEMISRQVRDLEERYREQRAAGADRPVDEWTSPPMVMAFLPGEMAAQAFFERAGADVVLRRELAARIGADARVQVVDREMIDRLLDELNLGSSELADPDTQIRLGRLLAARMLGFIDFAQAGPDTTMFVRLVNTETTAIDAQAAQDVTRAADCARAVQETVDALLAALNQKHPLQGLIALVEDGEILINLGEAHGVQPGDEFAVLKGGASVQVGGRTLQRPMTEIAALRVTAVEGDLSVCELIPESVEGDVELAAEMKVRARPADDAV